MTAEQKIKLDKVKDIANSIKWFLSLMMLVGLFLVLASPFVFIWETFVLSVKILATGIAMIVSFKFLHFVVVESIKKVETDLKQNEDKTV